MPYIFFGREQALETSLRLLVVSIHIHQNLRRAAIIGDVDGSHPDQSDTRIGQLSLNQSFDFFPQGLPQPPAMVLYAALLHSHLEVKRMRISENGPPVLALKCYCRAQWSDPGKYAGNNGIAGPYKYSTNESAMSAPWLLAMRVAARSTFFINPSR